MQRVQVGQGAGPLWGFLVIALGVLLLLAAGISSLSSALLTRSTATPSPSAVASASVAPPSKPNEPPPTKPSPPGSKSAIERASDGDTSALAELEGRPVAERSVADTVALAKGKAVRKNLEIAALGARAKTGGAEAGSDIALKLRRAADDPDTASEALRVMAELPGSLGPDLLYSIVSSRKKNDPLADLALALLATSEVRKKASPALAVALDVRAADKCDAAKAAVARAIEVGDRRAATPLGRFTQRSGCGESKRDDCWSCMRDGDDLKQALKQAYKRAPPKL